MIKTYQQLQSEYDGLQRTIKERERQAESLTQEIRWQKQQYKEDPNNEETRQRIIEITERDAPRLAIGLVELVKQLKTIEAKIRLANWVGKN